MELQKITDSVKASIPKIAKAMEHIFMNLIINHYNQKQAQKAAAQYGEWINDIKPDYQKYNDIKRELKSELSNLLLYYKDETAFKELCSKIPEYEEKRKKQKDLQNMLETKTKTPLSFNN